MKLFRVILPNLTIALNIAAAIVVYLDLRNPMMGFLVGAPFLTLMTLCIVCSVTTAAMLFRHGYTESSEKDQKESVNTTKNIEVALDI